MTNSTQNWKIGLGLTLITVFFWSTLPVSLKISLDAMDAWSLTWLRFVFAALLTLLILMWRKKLAQFKRLNAQDWFWLSMAAIMLVANYIFFLYGLKMTSPANAQVFIQLAPLLLTLGGVLLFKESFNRIQMLGALAVLLGLSLFFKDQIGLVVNADYNGGILIIVAAAVTWSIYALIQKKLSSKLSSQAILFFIYVFASFSLVFSFDGSSVSDLNQTQWIAILYACFNTVAAYAAFAEALNYWNASRVGMVLAVTPVVTLFFINLSAQLFPELIEPESIHHYGWVGVAMIVCGSMLASLKK